MDLESQRMLFELLGGLGIFLYGIATMRTGLQNCAGNKLKDILDRFTTNPLIGFLAGILVTVMIQSSTATTVITVGLVSVGFMTLRQAIGVILGANIGTTVTAIIIGFNIEEYSLLIIAIGSFLVFLFNKKTIQNVGQIIFGLGALFYGLDLFRLGMEPIGKLEVFKELVVQLSSMPLLGVLSGTISTMLIHSSSAAVGILQGLYADSLLSIEAALPILYGDNIGTTLTAVIVSLGASTAAKRAAGIHVLINVIGTILFLILLKPFAAFILWNTSVMHLSPEMAIAFAHAIYNILSSLLFLPFINVLILSIKKLIPGEDSVIEYRVKRLDSHLIKQSTVIALGQAKEEVIYMGKFAIKGLEDSHLFFKTKKDRYANSSKQIAEFLNSLERKITKYLVDIGLCSLSDIELEEQNKLIHTVRDIERIGHLFENIIEHSNYQLAIRVNLTDHALECLEKMFELTVGTVQESITALDQNNKELAKKVIEKEFLINKIEEELRTQHVNRLQSGEYSPQAGIVFMDMISNLEQIGNHAVNIANRIVTEQTFYSEIR
ncbi:Na/Pi cotransporter family protein [Niallia endozanthoxylica]|uniref:Na/Pi cotransporter family protein n=1 Tax=Niallia endozanthoxylica TaxID=2036016 RepID=UPI00168AF5AA|nr:Na/Pi cotransporter family protein [Niallia endozanthoxylica]